MPRTPRAASLSLALFLAAGAPVPHGALAQRAAPSSAAAPAAAPPSAQPQPASQPTPQPQPAPTTRRDVARVYLDFERALRDFPPPADRRAAVNRAFDAATLTFFGGGLAATARAVREATLGLLPAAERDSQAALGTLSVRVEPDVWWPGAPAPRLRVRSLAPLPAPLAPAWTLRKDEDADPFMRVTQPELPAGAIVDIDAPLPLPPGATNTRTLHVRVGEGRLAPDARVALLPRPIDEIRTGAERDIARALEALPATADGDDGEGVTPAQRTLRRAALLARARTALLTANASETDSARFLADMHALASDVPAEAAAVARGENPYAQPANGAAVTLWRPVILHAGAGGGVPCVVHAPARQGDAPRPLVVALHGAGGDESMFIEGYGAGVLRELADVRGFVLASPATLGVAQSAGVLPALVEQLREDYDIDPARVYVLGHSLGAGAALGLTRAHPDLVRAAAIIAGGGAGRVRGRADAPNMPPVLLVSGGLDPLFAPARANAALESLRAVSNGAEHFPYPAEGHTLVVGESMTRVIDWLLAR